MNRRSFFKALGSLTLVASTNLSQAVEWVGKWPVLTAPARGLDSATINKMLKQVYGAAITDLFQRDTMLWDMLNLQHKDKRRVTCRNPRLDL